MKWLLLYVLAVASAVYGNASEFRFKLSEGLNIPKPVEVAPQDRRYEAYSVFKKSLAQAAEFKASPCNDFYNYTCQHADVENYFMVIDAANTKNVIEGLKRSANGAPKWYQILKNKYDACVTRNVSQRTGEELRRIYSEMTAEFGSVFPLLQGSSNMTSSPARLGEIVGYLAQKFELNTLLSYKIEGNRLLIDEPKLAFPEVYFTEAFNEFETEYKVSIKDYLQQLAEVLGKGLDEDQLDESIEKVVRFEKELAKLLVQIPDELPSHLRLSELTCYGKSIDFNAFFARITKNSELLNFLTSTDHKIYLTSPKKSSTVQTFVAETDPATVLNYLNVRLARSLRKYFITKPKECVADQWLRAGRGVKHVGIVPPIPKKDPYVIAENEERCIDELYQMGVALDRVYLDQNLPDKTKRKEFVKRVKVIAKKIITGFRHQIEQFSSFTPKVKAAAYRKIDAMLYNVVYDDWIENDNVLNKHYESLINDQDFARDDELTSAEKIRDFAQSQAWESVLGKDRRNLNFTWPIRTVNAWYLPELNNFYIPLGVLQRPLFDVNYPAAIQYGGIGYVVGHEITHGFDTNGVEYDDQGEQNPWMDETSWANFNDMAECVIAEYDELHGRGRLTQAEDIADNGGLRATFNSFKAEQALYGLDPQLPGQPWNKFTQDQLFFLAFAHVWCSNVPKEDDGADAHSPLFARIHGTLQNTPAFRAAYNCPVGSSYAPKKHCDVWA
ncbi:unnamed protein product [Bursaphelenchus xylophilus]|uniref:(pine wood nematode) hypothetical protein n=1 Tax=Bursaphelenchus xylophilus TaxID=6326 RepID=A0A1I7SAV6_BURXY|nr:unnamed protein product [Bursaphelenchus xylophilus]CAG9126732.1 unnamed protein product [Bursaphelenchus xylophilus]